MILALVRHQGIPVEVVREQISTATAYIGRQVFATPQWRIEVLLADRLLASRTFRGIAARAPA